LTKLRRGSRPGAALALCGAVLFIPLLLIRNGPAASASPAPDTAAGRHAAAAPADARPPASDRTRGTGHPKASHRAAPAQATTVADQTTASGTLPGPPAGSAADPSAADPSAATDRTPPTTSPPVTEAAPPSPAVRTSDAPTPPPVTTTTLAPVHATGAGVVTHGIVTYYNHPAGRCASPWIPFGTTVWITNPANGESVSCVVDDYETDTSRSIDLATATFAEIAPLSQGVIHAELSW
jgi:hypothetical protein